MAGVVFGEVQVSFFLAGAVFGEIWNDSRSAKCCIFQYNMLVAGVKSNLGCEAGCGVTVSCSDPARIILGMVSDRSRIVNSVSCVTRVNHEIHFSWQAQYLVSLDNDTCCSAHCK